MPLVRTFAPFVAGAGGMSYGRFQAYNVAGGIVWTASFLYGGYFFGNLPVVKQNFSLVILAIIVPAHARRHRILASSPGWLRCGSPIVCKLHRQGIIGRHDDDGHPVRAARNRAGRHPTGRIRAAAIPEPRNDHPLHLDQRSLSYEPHLSHRTGWKSYDFPTVEGAENELAVDISNFRDRTGYITLDDGYAYRLLHLRRHLHRWRQGHLALSRIPIEQLAQHSSFVETAWLVIWGRLPTEDELERFSRWLL